jgi:hypothetical protein
MTSIQEGEERFPRGRTHRTGRAREFGTPDRDGEKKGVGSMGEKGWQTFAVASDSTLRHVCVCVWREREKRKRA